jgi:hypothetical protein
MHPSTTSSQYLLLKTMIKSVNSLLRLVIPLLLVFCCQPALNKNEQTNLQSFQNSSELAQFAPAILESSIGIFNLNHREHHKSPDKYFQYALISDQLLITLTQQQFSFFLEDIDHFSNKIWLSATANRAPPASII